VNDSVALPTQTASQNGVGKGQDVNVGFDIRMTPTILEGQDVDVDVKLSQSNRVGLGIGSIPIVASHKVETRIYLKSGEVGAIASINKQDIGTSFNKDDVNPGSFSSSSQGGTQTKALFSFQRSKNMQRARGQFVVFISPLIIDSASEGTEDLKKNFRISAGNH
jgi:pilus assembly protein CpaC